MVQAFLDANGGPTLRLALSRDFEVAEKRSSVRLAAAAGKLCAVVNREPECLVTDISAGGLGVVAATAFHRDDVVFVELTDGSESFAGNAIVRSVSDRQDNSYRYGLEPVRDAIGLRRGLQKMTQIVQREQLRRMRNLA
jgi:hypothetical protein